MIDLPKDQLETVSRIIAEHVPGCEVRVFGSRVKGSAKPWSDLDVALVGAGKLDLLTVAGVREALEESDLPVRVDILDWHSISPEFRAVIEEGFEVL